MRTGCHDPVWHTAPSASAPSDSACKWEWTACDTGNWKVNYIAGHNISGAACHPERNNIITVLSIPPNSRYSLSGALLLLAFDLIVMRLHVLQFVFLLVDGVTQLLQLVIRPLLRSEANKRLRVAPCSVRRIHNACKTSITKARKFS